MQARGKRLRRIAGVPLTLVTNQLPSAAGAGTHIFAACDHTRPPASVDTALAAVTIETAATSRTGARPSDVFATSPDTGVASLLARTTPRRATRRSWIRHLACSHLVVRAKRRSVTAGVATGQLLGSYFAYSHLVVRAKRCPLTAGVAAIDLLGIHLTRLPEAVLTDLLSAATAVRARADITCQRARLPRQQGRAPTRPGQRQAHEHDPEGWR